MESEVGRTSTNAMMKTHKIFYVLAILSATCANTQQLPVGSLLNISETPAHDPVMIKQDSIYYIFCTGIGISVWSSRDLKNWKKEKPVFDKPPQWAIEAVPGYKGHTWAPDIQFYNGQYYLFYSVSQFGKNTSCIGLAVNKTLEQSSPDYRWRDMGKNNTVYPWP